MAKTQRKRADVAAYLALIGVITLLSLGLALWTDLPIVARGAIAVVSGIIAAAITYSLVQKKRSE